MFRRFFLCAKDAQTAAAADLTAAQAALTAKENELANVQNTLAATENVLALTQDPAFYHRVPCVGGLMEEEAQTLLQDFFEKRRTGDKPHDH